MELFKHPLPTRRLPERPDLDQLKRQAKELLEAFVAGEDEAVAEVTRSELGEGSGDSDVPRTETKYRAYLVGPAYNATKYALVNWGTPSTWRRA